MKTLLLLACVSLLLQAATAGAERPQIGDVVATQTDTFRGWDHLGGGLGPKDQTYTVFGKGDIFLIALTQPVTLDTRGGILVEKITKTRLAKPLPGEERRDDVHCGWAALGDDGMPVVAFYNPRRSVARGYFVAKNRIFVARWLAKSDDCPPLASE